MVPSQIPFHCATMGTPRFGFLLDDLGKGKVKIVLDWVLSENGTNLLTEYLFFFLLFRAVPAAYRSSQAGVKRAASAAYTTAQGNARSLTH